jgi:dihydroorotase
MIDPHVHLRDWNQAQKETLRHGLSVAWRAGLDGVFEMPNTDPPLTSREAILRRIGDADKAMDGAGIRIFHGLYAGITAVPRQIEEVVRAWRELFPRVVGLKLFAGHSTGNMGIVDPREQALVYRTLAALGFNGVLAVHCEKESLLRASEWDPARPVSHARARPPAAEVASVDDQKAFARAAGFKGTLHVCHISTPWAVDLVRGTHEKDRATGREPETRAQGTREPETRAQGTREAAQGPRPKDTFRVTCGLAPHHALLDAGMMEGKQGILLKVNPPLRPLPMPALMMQKLLTGEIDWIETDHAPHSLEDKTTGHASGLPGFPFYPRFVRMVEQRGMSRERLAEVTHGAICRVFGITVAESGRKPETNLAGEYPFDPFSPVAGSAP